MNVNAGSYTSELALWLTPSVLKSLHVYLETCTEFLEMVLTVQGFSSPKEWMEISRTALGSATLDGLLYAVGGECAYTSNVHTIDTRYLGHVECYDPLRKKWSQKSSLNEARSFIAVVALRGHLFALGEYHSKGVSFVMFALGSKIQTCLPWSVTQASKNVTSVTQQFLSEMIIQHIALHFHITSWRRYRFYNGV